MATSAIIGCPSRAICIIAADGNEQQMIVAGTSRRASFVSVTAPLTTGPGSGTARSRKRSRSSSVSPSRLTPWRSCSNGGSGTSTRSVGTSGRKTAPSAVGPLK